MDESARADLAARLSQFHKQGFVVLRNVFPASAVPSTDTIESLLRRQPSFELLSSGRRWAVPLEGCAPLLDVVRGALSAPPVQALIESILDEDAHIVEVSTITSLPGAGAQPLHRDSRFGVRKESINVIVPMVPFNAVNGGTEYIPGSHRFNESKPLQRVMTVASLDIVMQTVRWALRQDRKTFRSLFQKDSPFRLMPLVVPLLVVNAWVRSLLAKIGGPVNYAELGIQQFTANVGDVLLYKRDLIHRGPANKSEAPRHAINVLIEAPDFEDPFETSRKWRFLFGLTPQASFTAVFRDYGTLRSFTAQQAKATAGA